MAELKPEIAAAKNSGILIQNVPALIDTNKVAGRVKASSAKKIGEIIESHPDKSLAILRGWMAESL